MHRTSTTRRAPADREFGVYVHIPFCASRCDYCDFATWTDRAHLIDDYVDACVRDIGAPGRRRASARRDERVLRWWHAVAARRPPRSPRSSTPSRARRVPRSPSSATPTPSTRASSRDYAARRREPPVVRRAVDARARARRARPHPRSGERRARRSGAARAAGFERINLDLIYGTPGESRRRLGGHPRRRARTRARATSARTPSRWRRARRSARWSRPASAPRPTTTTRPRSTSSPTTGSSAAGLPWYEISNWARPGDECRHNLLYWRQGDYAAIGCAAHGHTRRSPLVERPHARALRRGGRGRRTHRRPGGDPRRRGPGRRGAAPRAPHASGIPLAGIPRAGIKLRAEKADLSGVAACVDDLVRGRAPRAGRTIGWSSRVRGGCWPTTSSPASWRPATPTATLTAPARSGLIRSTRRWHSVESSANGARRAQGRDPPGHRGGAHRHRPAGGVADDPRRSAALRRLERDGAQRDDGARARGLHRAAAHVGRPDPHRSRLPLLRRPLRAPAGALARGSGGPSPTSSRVRVGPPGARRPPRTRRASCSPG